MKISTNRHFIDLLISEGEHQQQDFKFEISNAKKIAKSLSAFANTYGGRLLIGVKDNGKIAGIQSEEELYMIEAAADLYCTPKVAYDVEEYEIDGKSILVIQIPQAKQKPVLAKDEKGKMWAYVRIKDENILASKVHLEVWKHKKKQKGEFVSYTQEEKLFLKILEDKEELTLNQFIKTTQMPRYRVIRLLTKFILFGIIEPQFKDRNFVYRLL